MTSGFTLDQHKRPTNTSFFSEHIVYFERCFAPEMIRITQFNFAIVDPQINGL